MALTNYFVDPGGGSDVTGDGSIGTPWASVQHALDTITRDNTNGDQINIKAGTADVLAAPLSLATYGTPMDAAPLVLRGYTNTSNDGGRGDLNGNAGGFPIFASGYNYVHVIDMICHNVGDANLISLGNQAIVVNCIVHTAARNEGFGVGVNQGALVARCHIYNVRGRAINLGGAGMALGNYIQDGATYDANPAIFCGGQTGTMVMSNIIRLQRVGSEGVYCYRGWGSMVGYNIIYQAAAGTSNGIRTSLMEAYGISIIGNIICGFSGVGGRAIFADDKRPAAVGHNAFYNNTINEQYDAAPVLDLSNDISLAADPFTDAANGDFSLTDAAKAVLRSAGWPSGWLGLDAVNDPHITIGPLQYGPLSGGGGAGVIRRVMRVLGG